MIVFTIGHSTRTLVRFIELLRGAGVHGVLDVRRKPVSRRHPHFSRDRLAAALTAADIAYAHAEALGGHREPRADSHNLALRNAAFRGYADHMQTDAFASAVEELLHLAAERPTAVMCAEADPSNCHRSLLADALVARSIRVHHILEATVEEHVPHPRLEVEGLQVRYPARKGPPQAELFSGAGR